MAPMRPPRLDSRTALQRLNSARGRAAIKPAPQAGRAVAAVLRPLAKKYGPGLTEITEHWNEIAGERLSKLARPVKLTRGRKGGTLTLRTRGPAATLLQAETPRLIERANLYCGEGAIARIAFQQGPLSFKPAMTPKKAPPVRRGLTPSETQSLENSLDGIESERLRAALQRLGRAVLSRSAP